ncbi:uncharacterized protein METZ01_LOCUS103424, partial [marine metagenome]
VPRCNQITPAGSQDSSTRRCPQPSQQPVEQVYRKEYDQGANRKNQQQNCYPFDLATPLFSSSRILVIDHLLSAEFFSMLMLPRLTRAHNTLCLTAHRRSPKNSASLAPR